MSVEAQTLWIKEIFQKIEQHFKQERHPQIFSIIYNIFLNLFPYLNLNRIEIIWEWVLYLIINFSPRKAQDVPHKKCLVLLIKQIPFY